MRVQVNKAARSERVPRWRRQCRNSKRASLVKIFRGQHIGVDSELRQNASNSGKVTNIGCMTG
jgi:hypothetical protein